MPEVRVDGVGLAVTEWPGEGPAVVMIHGLTANHTCWASVADALAGEFRLIGYDLRGRGASDKPSSGYSLAIHGRDLAGLLDHFGLRRAVVMGHSLGAHIALAFAVSHPARVSGLVLVDGGLDVRPEVLASLAPATSRVGTEYESLDAFLEMVRGLPMFAGRWNEYLERYFRYDVETLPSGRVRSRVARHAIDEELRNLGRERLWAWHHQVRCPTLILRAPDGLLTATDCLMTADEGRAMVRAIPRATLTVVPGTNHYTVLLARSPVVTRALRRFLRAPAPGRRAAAAGVRRAPPRGRGSRRSSARPGPGSGRRRPRR
jgi:pimeloyl-ACP methyl ester carboxylesterase